MVNDMIQKIMEFVSAAIIIVGAIAVLMAILYGIAALWWRLSTFAKLIAEYLSRRNDFEKYKNQYDFWKREKESGLMKCEKCHYYAELFGKGREDN